MNQIDVYTLASVGLMCAKDPRWCHVFPGQGAAVNRLVKAGMLERKRGDDRSVVITPKGETALSVLWRTLDAMGEFK